MLKLKEERKKTAALKRFTRSKKSHAARKRAEKFWKTVEKMFECRDLFVHFKNESSPVTVCGPTPSKRKVRFQRHGANEIETLSLRKFMKRLKR